MVEEGVAEPAGVDRVMDLGYRHPVGPLRLTDLVGLDVRLDIARHLASELGERSMYAALASLILATHLGGAIFRPPLGPTVNPRTVATSHRPFRTADGAIERPELMRDPRFARLDERSQHFDALYELIESLFGSRSTDAWCDGLDEAGIPYALVRTTREVVGGPEFLCTGFFRDVQHETEGALRLATSPIRFTEASCSLHRVAGGLGCDTREVRLEAGCDDAAIDALLGEG
jgi:hypothetical protein